MLAYVIRRVFQSIFVLLMVGLVAFSMFRFVGDPVENLLGQERTQADIERVRDQLGLNDPFPVQYVKFLGNALQGNLGVSYRQGRPVSEIIAERAPATLELAGVSALFAVVFGVGLGVFTAIRRDGLHGEFHHDDLADRGLAANLFDRHRADLDFRCGAAMAASPTGAVKWCKSGGGQRAF
jgi:peptide/nickel transport system permease protein